MSDDDFLGNNFNLNDSLKKSKDEILTTFQKYFKTEIFTQNLFLTKLI